MQYDNLLEIQKKVQKETASLSLPECQSLSLLFVEHILHVSNDKFHGYAIYAIEHFYQILFAYQNGGETSDSLTVARKKFESTVQHNDRLNGISYKISPFFPKSTTKQIELLFMLYDLLQHRDDASNNPKNIKFKETTCEIAHWCRYVKALEMSETHWDSNDIGKKREARKEGRKASVVEGSWQIDLIACFTPK